MGKQSCGRTTWVGVWITVLALLAGCDSPTKLSPLANDAVILAFGNSLTFGTGAGSEQSYPTILSDLIDREVINAGVPGEETAQGLARLTDVLDDYQPELLILCHGGNDILRKRNRQDTAKNLGAMIQMAKDRNIEVILVGVPAFGPLVSTANFYGDVAKKFQIPFEEGILADILSDHALKSDMIHPNAQGYRVFAETMALLLRDRGAIQ